MQLNDNFHGVASVLVFAMLSRRSLVFNLCTQTKSQYRSKYEWITPVGHDTGIKVYHEIAKRRVPLIFPNPNYVKWYMCGPTVYDTAHIGHASCYIKSDIIRRVLREYYDIDAVVAIGVTDVSEKIYERSKVLGQNSKNLAKRYELEFFTQMKMLNILPPSMILRVSDHMAVLTNFVAKLVQIGAAYKTVDGSIYFKTRVHSNYGRFKEPVADVDQEKIPGKFDPLDFALWKANKNALGKGMGIPGWHIQCSAMASHVFGESLDIHSGGMDLIFPHHENEESQSTSYYDSQQWVNYWFHTGLLNMGDEKMSKSLQNYISISRFLEEYSSDHLRMFCMMSPYRNNSTYDLRAIRLAVSVCEKVVRFLSVSDSYLKGTWLLGNINEAELLEDMANSHIVIRNSLSNDFGVQEALKCMLHLVKKAMKMLSDDTSGKASRSPAVIASLRLHVYKFFKSFGFSFAEDACKNEVPNALEALIDATVDFRIKVREKALFLDERDKRKIMSLCDESRDNLQSIGIIMNDLSPSHTHWSLKTTQSNKGSTLKNVIDVLVWFRAELMKLIPSLMSAFTQKELKELCRWTKMHLSTLGVIIEDFEDGRSYWSFPKTDYEATAKFEMIISSTLKFYADIRKIAFSLTDGKSSAQAKEEILKLCDTATSDLQSFGVIVNDIDASNPNWLLEVNNNKGVSILQNVMDMLMGSRDQVRSLAPLAKDSATSSKLENICFKTRKFLTCYGLKISDSYDRNNPTLWTIDEKMKNKILVKNLIDVLIMFMNEIKQAAESLEDVGMRELLLDIFKSLKSDLKGIGVMLVTEGTQTKWSFKECESVVEVQQD